MSLRKLAAPNTAPPRGIYDVRPTLPSASTETMVVGRFAVRVFEQFSWLEVGSVKAASSRPAMFLVSRIQCSRQHIRAAGSIS